MLEGMAVEEDLDLVGSQDAGLVARDEASDQSGRDECGAGHTFDECALAILVEESMVEFDRPLDEPSSEKHAVLGRALAPEGAVAITDPQYPPRFDALGNPSVLGAGNQLCQSA